MTIYIYTRKITNVYNNKTEDYCLMGCDAM
jgi:hypothetical protein